jgi:hypothetical protein
VPSFEWLRNSIVTIERHCLQMNCWAVGKRPCYPLIPSGQ